MTKTAKGYQPKQKCICQICTCGRHRCPNKDCPNLQLGSNDEIIKRITEYGDHYQLKEGATKEPRLRAKDNLELAPDPLDAMTTSRSDFKPFYAQRPQITKERGLLRPEGDMEFQSSYQSEYDGKQGNRSEPIQRGRDLLVTPGAFYGVPTYKDDYQKWDIDRPRLAKREADTFSSEEPLDTRTTAREDFKENLPVPRESLRPHTTLKVGEGPPEMLSSNRSDYVAMPLQTRNNTISREPYVYSPSPFVGETTNRSDYIGGKGERVATLRPHTSTQLEGEFAGLSTSQGDYKAYPIEKAKSMKPQGSSVLQYTEPFDSPTTVSQDYRPWEVHRPEKRKPESLVSPSGDLDLNTTSKMAFPEHRIEKTRSLRPTTATKVGGEFSGETTNRDAYRGTSGDKVQSIRPEIRTVRSSEPFDGETTVGRDYIPWEVKRPEVRRPEASLASVGGMDLMTTHNAEYIQKSASRPIAVRPQTMTKLAGGDFNGVSTNRSDYVGQSSDKARILRPQTNSKFEGDFLGETTTNSAYQPWKSQRPEPRRQETETKLDGDMDLQTVTRADFADTKGDRAQNLRPNTSQKLEGLFDDRTTHRENFKGLRRASPVQRVIHHPEYRPPSGNFEGLSTSRTDYLPFEVGERVRPVRRWGSNPLIGNNNFDGATSYRSDFAQYPMRPCPAEGLKGTIGNDAFTYHTDIGGHHFFTPITPILV